MVGLPCRMPIILIEVLRWVCLDGSLVPIQSYMCIVVVRGIFLRQDEIQLKFAAANGCFAGERGANDAQHTHPPITFRWVMQYAK